MRKIVRRMTQICHSVSFNCSTSQRLIHYMWFLFFSLRGCHSFKLQTLILKPHLNKVLDIDLVAPFLWGGSIWNVWVKVVKVGQGRGYPKTLWNTVQTVNHEVQFGTIFIPCHSLDCSSCRENNYFINIQKIPELRVLLMIRMGLVTELPNSPEANFNLSFLHSILLLVKEVICYDILQNRLVPAFDYFRYFTYVICREKFVPVWIDLKPQFHS